MKIRLVATGALALLGATGLAHAADMPVAYKAAPATVYSWTGFYAGINFGGSAGADSVFQRTYLGTQLDITNQSTHSPFGGIGGLQAGYNSQFGNLVLGVEADAQVSGQKSRESCLTYCELPLQFDKVSQALPWFATVRARFGYAAGPVLFFVTGGAAFTRVDTSYSTNNVGNFSGTLHTSRTGYAAGAGIEAALAGNWTAKAEYLYLDFGNVTSSAVYPDNFGGGFIVTTPITSSVRDHIFRVGLNYAFSNRAAPVYAPPAMVTKAPVAVATVYNWTGFYVGGNVGYSVGRGETSRIGLGNIVDETEKMELVTRGVIGGAQAGFNWQSGNWVAGVEGDYQFADQKDSARFNVIGNISFSTIDQRLAWFATGRGRVGYAAGPALFYATGGVAFTEIKTNAALVNTVSGNSGAAFTNSRTGWVAGAGIEGVLTGNWTLKAEYLYMDFGTFTDLFAGAPALGNLRDPNLRLVSHVRDNIARVGLNYHFGQTDRVVARY
jgi:outer membrane immunogenic protein